MAKSSELSNLFYPQIIDVKESIFPLELRDNDIDSILLEKIRKQIGNRCNQIGYIDENTLKIISRSIGKINTSHFNGQVYYDVKCEAGVCLPVEGDRIRAKVVGKSKTGILCIRNPLKIVIANLHHEDKSFMDILEKGDEVLIEVIGTRFQLNDKALEVVAKFIKKFEK
jgi:hypothetical protein